MLGPLSSWFSKAPPALAWGVLMSCSLASFLPAAEDAKPISFNFQIRPLLAANCYSCHGPDEKRRKKELRMDERESAIKKAIVPGDADGSELIKRLYTTDKDDVMPPPESHRRLTDEQKQLLRRWVAEGAAYEKHWAFIPPAKPVVPDIQHAGFKIRNPIDAFVLKRLADEGLQPSMESSRERWLRRVSFDLTGLPPKLAEIDAFLADTSSEAQAKVVDRLLASSAYGERMATDWLDAARYADTYGRHEDQDSAVWPYRDWVVAAFNRNMPYDEFLKTQTAGDLLPNPTRDQHIATAFNRLVQQSNEAGSNEEEFRQEHVVDRVRTNATAILGLTMECARCHDHKFDPLTMRDFYQMSAFFNNIDELGLFSRLTNAIPAPGLLLMKPDEEKKNTELLTQIAALEKQCAELKTSSKDRYAAWVKEHGVPPMPTPLARYEFENVGSRKRGDRKMIPDVLHPGANVAKLKHGLDPQPGVHGYALYLDDDNMADFEGVGRSIRRSDTFSFAFWFKPGERQDRAVVLHRSRGGLDAASRGYELLLNDLHPEFALNHFAPGNSIRIRTKKEIPLNEWTHLTVTYDGSSRADGMRIYLNGEAAEIEVMSDHLYRDILYRAEWGDFDQSKLQDNPAINVDLALGWRRNDRSIKKACFDDFEIYDKALTATEARALAHPAPVKPAAPAPGFFASMWQKMFGSSPKAEPVDSAPWFETWLRDHDKEGTVSLVKLHELRTAQDDIANDAQEIMVMREMTPRRPTYVLNRGQFDQKTEAVQPEVPASLFPMPLDVPRNRLGLAAWYVDKRNPLTARVFVNRVWQMFFGRGIVGTQEDFGIRGDLPTHPELLDWLATEFMDSGWDVKALCRMIALSSTYRQSSTPRDPKLLADDPQNLLLARGPRHRLSAEMVRDNALAVSGLLVSKAGGPPVKPYQPDNLYEDSGVQAHYDQGHGDDLCRRSLYTYWKRTMPPPSMSVFDAPTREFCRVRRESTSTPLQALTLLNDPEFLEPCRVLAQKLLKAHAKGDAALITEAFRLFTSRQPTDDERRVLGGLLVEERNHFQSRPADADALLKKNGEAPVDDTLTASEVAATTMLLRVLMSDDECLVEQ